MDNNQIIKLKLNLSDLESKEKDAAKLVETKKRNKVIGMVMAIAGILLALAVDDVPNISNLQTILVLTGIAGAVIWYINWKAFKKKKPELDSLNSEIEKIKKEIIEAEHR